MDAMLTDYRAEVLSLIRDAPHGLTIPDLLGHFERWRWPEVKEAAIDLECEMVVHRVGRNAITASGHHVVHSVLTLVRGWKP